MIYKEKNNIISFEVLTVVTRSTAFCVTTPSSLVDRYQHYRQMCCPHLQNQVSKKVPIKCWPIYQVTWCHITYSILFQAVLTIMFLTCTWEWSNFNSGCDMSDFKAFHNFRVYGGKFHSSTSIMSWPISFKFITTSTMPQWDTK